MLKREIAYEDFNGNQVTDTFYFHLSETELMEWELDKEEGLYRFIQNIVKTENTRELIKLFKDLVLMAYGEKTDDGKRFIKSDELRTAFSQTAAYQHMFMELATNDQAAVTFITGLLPRNLVEKIETEEKLRDQDKPTGPPVSKNA